MILPPQRGHERPRVVCFSTSIPRGLSSAISSMTPQQYKDRTEDRDRRRQQHQHAEVKTANEASVRRISQSGAAHRTLCVHVNTRQKQDESRRQNHQQQRSPTTQIHYGSSTGAGATGGGCLNWYRNPMER